MIHMIKDTQAALSSTSATPVRTRLREVARDSAWIVLGAATLSLLVNSLRTNHLPLIAKSNYEIMVPCPEPLGTAEVIAATDPRVSSPTSLLIDARAKEDYAAWHLPTAISIPFDWLAEQDEINRHAQIVARDVARSAKRAVVIYGDGAEPDSGHQWASLLNLAGIRNVSSVAGGAAALGGPSVPKEQP